ncbi:hypothetical protein Q5752_005946 [Cryptotrichosporon argae]
MEAEAERAVVATYACMAISMAMGCSIVDIPGLTPFNARGLLVVCDRLASTRIARRVLAIAEQHVSSTRGADVQGLLALDDAQAAHVDPAWHLAFQKACLEVSPRRTALGYKTNDSFERIASRFPFAHSSRASTGLPSDVRGRRRVRDG